MRIISRTPRITYLIDSENVSDAWIRLLPELKKRDRVVVFYTEHTSNLAADSVRMITEYKKYDITWEKCFTGNNALDFQLVSRLGFYICQEPGDEYVIMSNDTGYDAAVKYWVQAGYTLKRIPGYKGKSPRKEQKRLLPGPARNCKKAKKPPIKKENKEEILRVNDASVITNPVRGASMPMSLPGDRGKITDLPESKKETDVQPEKRMEKETAGKPVPLPKPSVSEPQIPAECVLKLCRSIPINKSNWLHEALVALLGAENGREVYYFLKDNKEFHDKLSAVYIKDKNERIDNYIQAVLSGRQLDVVRTEELRGVIFRYAPNNFNGIYRGIVDVFGKETGAKYYAALKPHIHMIRRI